MRRQETKNKHEFYLRVNFDMFEFVLNIISSLETLINVFLTQTYSYTQRRVSRCHLIDRKVVD